MHIKSLCEYKNINRNSTKDEQFFLFKFASISTHESWDNNHYNNKTIKHNLKKQKPKSENFKDTSARNLKARSYISLS